MSKKQKNRKRHKVVDSFSLLKAARQNPEGFLVKHQFDEFIISGVVGNYQVLPSNPTAMGVHFLRMNKRPDRVHFTFGKEVLPQPSIIEGTKVVIKGNLHFVQFTDPEEIFPTFSNCKFVSIGESDG